MEYMNRERLAALSPKAFQTQRPYPWVNIEGSLTTEGYERLRQTLPDVSRFQRQVNVKRAYGQTPHDRYLLHYQPSMELAQPHSAA